MGKRILLMAILMGVAATSAAQTVWVTAGETAYQHLRRAMPAARLQASRMPTASLTAGAERLYLLKVPAKSIPRLSRLLHSELKHCGGFMQHTDEATGRRALAQNAVRLPSASRPAYTIANEAVVVAALAMMDEQNIAQSIQTLSAFPNRLYSSKHGAAASASLRDTWAAHGARHGGIVVEQIAHAGYGQASVIATIAGSDLAAEVVVLGAHLDSINVGILGDKANAPGADDDASGVASLTEILRVLTDTRYAPRRTIKLIAYAAEEVGLRGSQAIARDFKKKEVNVVGVLQLDMTNYKGSPKDIYLLSDYTDADQNAFLAKLIETYLPALTVGVDRCGYACSDHASWQAEGYPTSMPFESALAQDNPHIHTKRDTYANSGNQAVHALKFARLGAAFTIELGSSSP